MPATSLPAPDSDKPKPDLAVPAAIPGQVAVLLLFRAGDHHRPRRQPRQQQHESCGVRVLGNLLDGDGQSEDAGTGAAVFLGDAQPEQAGVPEGDEQVFRVLSRLVDLPGASGCTLSLARRRTTSCKAPSSSERSKFTPSTIVGSLCQAAAEIPGRITLRITLLSPLCQAGDNRRRRGESTAPATLLAARQGQAGLAWRRTG